ncbi:MAG: two-component system chemotaxis response regulator CheY [Planctomycetota bacterium]|jgi:two-component system chemotaxis response regulator CheY
MAVKGERMRALVVDDSRTIRTILRSYLQKLDFEVFDAADGKLALERLEEVGPVEVALVDWNMPHMNGFEFVQAVRADKQYEDVQIVMVTTETEMEQVTKALEAGANEYIMKPFSQEVIGDKLSMLGILD